MADPEKQEVTSDNGSDLLEAIDSAPEEMRGEGDQSKVGEGVNAAAAAAAAPRNASRNGGLGSRRVSVYIDHKYVPGFKFRIFSPPRQRQKWGDNQVLPRVNWGDLFFDLFYVAAFYNLGTILVQNPTAEGVLYFLGCFFPIMKLWLDKMFYDSRFVYGDDVFHKLFEAAVLVNLATAVSYIAPVKYMSQPSKGNVEMFGFALSILVGAFLNTFRVIECYFFGRGQRNVIEASTLMEMKWTCLPLTFLLAATIYAGLEYFKDDKGNDYDTDDHRLLAEGDEKDEYAFCDDSYKTHVPILLLFFSVVAANLHLFVSARFLFPKNGEHKKFFVPMNIDFTIHRQGEWTMLVLGESILSLLIVDVPETKDYFVAFYSAIVTVILLQYLHFRSQPHDPDSHAMRRDKNAGILFSIMFRWYSAALIAVGASYKLFLYDFKAYRRLSFLPSTSATAATRLLASSVSSDPCGPDNKTKEQNIAHLFCGAMAMVFFCLDVTVLAHVGLQKEMGKCTRQGATCRISGQEKAIYNYKGIALVVFRCAITLFLATLSMWVSEPRALAEIGLAAVICQLVNRFLGDVFFPDEQHYGGHHHHHEGVDDEDDEYNEEYKWPNVTHAQSVQNKVEEVP